MKIKTRFAPSPTGYLHVGGARTALYSWLFARNHGGEFVLRMKTPILAFHAGSYRSHYGWHELADLEWDEGPYYQTKRFDRYNAVMDQMLEGALLINAIALKSAWKRCAKSKWRKVRSRVMTVAAATAMSIMLMMNRALYVLLTRRKVLLFLTIESVVQ